MSSPPRRAARLFDRSAWRDLAAIGVLVGLATLCAFVAADGDSAQTTAFATLALAELALVFALRSPRTAAWRLPLNRWLVASVAASVAVTGLAVYLPALHGPLQTTPLAAGDAVLVVAFALVPFGVVEAAKALLRRRAAPPRAP
jgi:magnesium-transporting ATPase (P-type)